MTKRGLIIGTYDTAVQGWTLTEWALSDPVHVSNYLDVPGRRKGPLDMSAALTDGDPVYESRTLTAVFETSEGNRLERESRISIMTNWLDGWESNIILPDDDQHYIVGRVSVAKLYNDLAHASVQVTAVCEPWRYNKEETVVVLEGATDAQTATLPNQGRLAVIPLLTVTGGEVLLVAGASSWALGPGTYALPDLLLPQGGKAVTYSGTGVLTFTYREGIL
jgi:hypothetical protein